MIAYLLTLAVGFTFFAFREEYRKELEKRTGKKRKKKKSFWWHMWHDGSNGPMGYVN